MSAPPTSADLWRQATAGTRRQLAFDIAVAAAFAVLFGLVQSATSLTTVWVTVVLALALAVRRVSLPVMLLAALAAALVQVITGEVAVAADIAYAPLAFVLGSHPTGAVRRLGLASTVVAVAVAGVWTAVGGNDQFAPSTGSGVGMAAITAVVVGGGWTAGYVRWQQRQAVQARMDAALGAAEQQRLEGLYRHEQERGRIAADMHDVVAHSAAVIAAQADGARYVLADDPARADEALRVIGDTARTAMNDVRGLLSELRSGEPPAPPEPPAVDRVLTRMRQSGLTITHARHGIPRNGPVADAAAYVLTESLTNALKHGDRGSPVDVVEDWRDGYRLRVTNVVPAGAPLGTGQGLRGMAERVATAGGQLSATPDGEQWVVEVRIPAEADR